MADTTTKPLPEKPDLILLNAILQAFFLGIVLEQAIKYYETYWDDLIWKRIYVAIVVLLATYVIPDVSGSTLVDLPIAFRQVCMITKYGG